MTERRVLTEPQPFLHLANAVARFPERSALRSPGRQLSFLELATQSARAASLLRRRGVDPGALVAVAVHNDLQLVFAEALFALAAIGGIYPGPVDATGEVPFDWLITGTPTPRFPAERTILVDQAFFAEAATISEPLELAAYESLDSVCRLLFSSGTTGIPSAVPISIRIAESRTATYEAAWMHTMPFMTLIPLGGGIGFNAAYSSIANADTYLCPGSAEENLAMIRASFVGSLHASPAQLADLVSAAEAAGGGLESLAVIYAAGSVLPAPLARSLRTWSTAELFSSFGSTEAGGVMNGAIADDGSVRYEPPLEGVRLEVVDDADRPLGVGRVGHLRIASPSLPDGYLFSSLETDAFRHGWFYSGDLAEVGADGSVILRGRSDEVLNVGGVKVDPAAVEAELSSLPDVDDVAVVSLEGPLSPEVVVAVAASGPVDLDRLAEAFTAAAQGLGLTTVFRVSSIPRNQMGKVLRHELAQAYRAAAAEAGA